MMNRYFSRITKSARGERFNPLTWPFFIATFAYGLGFTAFYSTSATAHSSLFIAMISIHPYVPILWGATAIVTILIGFTFLMFNIPPAGKVSGLVGFMLWVFASFCWGIAGTWLLLFSVAIPNMYFWIWQYLSLSVFRREDAKDRATMLLYDSGQYDDRLNPKDSKIDREDNRGRDVQSGGSYDNPDDGRDSSRGLDG